MDSFKFLTQDMHSSLELPRNSMVQKYVESLIKLGSGLNSEVSNRSE